LQLVRREETLVTRIPSNQFSQPFACEPDIGFRVNVTNLKWDGDIKGKDLSIRYEFDYMIMVLQDQVVTVSTEKRTQIKEKAIRSSMERLEDEPYPFSGEKDELLRKIFCYERDITSLKKSIYKAESRNADLNREVIHCQQLIQQLQNAIEEKNNHSSQIQPEADFSYWRTPPQPQKHNGLFTTRLKRMFLTAL
jgi:hypothetical protein